MTHPDRIDRLIVLNLPHPRGLLRELQTNPQQQKNSQYARDFQKPDAAKKAIARPAHLLGQGPGSPEGLRRGAQTIVDGRDAQLLQGQLSAQSRRMRRRRPKPPAAAQATPPIKCPVLLIHGLKDQALLPGALNDTWNWIDADLTLVTIPRRRPLRPAGRIRPGDPGDGQLAEPLNARWNAGPTPEVKPGHVRATALAPDGPGHRRRIDRALARASGPSAGRADRGRPGRTDRPRPFGRHGDADVHPAAARRPGRRRRGPGDSGAARSLGSDSA